MNKFCENPNCMFHVTVEDKLQHLKIPITDSVPINFIRLQPEPLGTVQFIRSGRHTCYLNGRLATLCDVCVGVVTA